MHKAKLVIAAVATVAAVLSMAPAAPANTAVRREPRGDAPRPIDLTRVVIDYGDTVPDLAILRIRVDGRFQSGDSLVVWFNRDPSDAGPELKLTGVVDSEYALRRVHTWGGFGHAVSCDRYSMKMYRDYRGATVRIDRDCLRNRPVRAAIRTRMFDGDQDWFGGHRRWLEGVRY